VGAVTDLRVMEIPANRMGLSEGFWIRWPELRLFLVQRGDDELANLIEEHVVHGEPISTREITVRR
jgi:hypothetical protein